FAAGLSGRLARAERGQADAAPSEAEPAGAACSPVRGGALLGMMGGYLERVVETGMTSLRHVRGSIHRAHAFQGVEEQQVEAPVAAPSEAFPPDETVFEPAAESLPSR